ncbi:WD40-repeat-containing domain protein [Sporodiniella umbellata]|nr:WD40-repeat-containing domain protein [Sporodiniella umbellata]
MQNFFQRRLPSSIAAAFASNVRPSVNVNQYNSHSVINEGDDDKREPVHRYIQPFLNHRQIGRPRKKKEEHVVQQTVARKRGRPRKDASSQQQRADSNKTPTTDTALLPTSSKRKKDLNNNINKRKELSLELKSKKNIDKNQDSSSSSNESSESSLKSDSSVDSNGDSCSYENSGSSSGIAEFESESESDDELENTYSERPTKKKKPFIDKAFAQVSLNNIIRRRDVIALNPRFGESKSRITRASRSLDYRESSSDDDADTESDKPNTKEASKIRKLPKQKRKRKVIPEKRISKKATSPRSKQKKSTQRKTNFLPVIVQDYTLSVVADSLVQQVADTKEKAVVCCDFEPHRSGQIQSDIVALAGSNIILMLDVQQEIFIKKYIHSERQESFQCIAWTTVPVDAESDMSSDEEGESCNILAAAGKLGSIKLLNPLQNECYRYLFGHQGMVVRMVFSEIEPRWLFSISVDHTVRLWDIGIPISTKDNSICLAKFIMPPSVEKPSAINVSRDLHTVIVGCSDGNLVHFQLTKELIDKFRATTTKNQEIEPVIINHLAVYPAGNEWHEGFIDDIYVLGQDEDESSPIFNHVISRGSNDMEIVIWNSQKSTIDDIEIYKSFDWPESNGINGLRFKVIEKQGQKVMIAGDYEGKIHIFNIDNEASRTLSDNSKEIISPAKILSHEASSSPIRDVSMSNDTRFIVAIDADNNTLIWTPTIVS